MQFNIIISNDAQEDLLQSSDWYEEQNNGLGEKFMLSIENCFETITNNPFIFAVYYSNVRKAKINKFPYSIFYFIVERNKIIIFAVIHNSRYEDAWKNRIE